MGYKVEIEGTAKFLGADIDLSPEELQTCIKVFNALEERSDQLEGTPSLSIYEYIEGKQELIF